MKTAITIILTAVYVAGAIVTFSHDRAMGKAHCWKSKHNNSVSSSSIVATAWPLYAILVGGGVVMGMDVSVYACGNRT